MDIAVIGGGAIGSLVAGLLKKSGNEITLVARREHVDAINKNSLLIKSSQGDENIKINAVTKLERNHELVIFTVKTQDLEQAYQDNHEYLEDCCIMTSQNGVQADTLLSTHFERKNMISSIVMFGSTYVNPGEVTYNFEGDWIMGKPYAPNDMKLNDLSEVLGKAFNVVVTRDIMGMKWLKLFINFNNCIPAVTGRSMQETFADMDLCKLSVMLTKEGVKIVKAAGIELVSLPHFPAERIYGLAEMPIEQSSAIINKTLTNLSKEPVYGSILQSIKRNKISEIDFINGEIAVISKGLRMEAPLNKRIVEMVHEVERSGKYFEFDQIKKEFNLN